MTRKCRWLLALSAIFVLVCQTGCQISYLAKSAYNQAKILASRESLEAAIKRNDLNESQKEKLILTNQIKEFATSRLSLKATKSYSSYVHLDRPYVSYVISAASENELKTYQWSYPIVGKMPYKGFFDESSAKEYEKELQSEKLDTYVRGTTAYSTLGWFNDPVLSSMLRGDLIDYVNVIIHESVHSTLYIKNSADFNERLAVFIAGIGTELFFKERLPERMNLLITAQVERQDERLFSEFIKEELRLLNLWYEKNQSLYQTSRNDFLIEKEKQFQEIKSRFESGIMPKLQTQGINRFKDRPLNNAILLTYRTYIEDLSEFDRVYKLCQESLPSFLMTMKSLEKSAEPDQNLKQLQACLK